MVDRQDSDLSWPAEPVASKVMFRYDEARQSLHDNPSCQVFVERLVACNRHSDALRFIAAAMPAREAVWWGTLCLWHVYRSDVDEKVSWAIQSAVRWVLDPSEKTRRAAASAMSAVDSRTPAGRLAHAAFWSGGNIADFGSVHRFPPEGATGQLVGVAVVSAAASAKKAKECKRHRHQFVQLGLEVLRGTNRWDAQETSNTESSATEETPVDAQVGRPA